MSLLMQALQKAAKNREAGNENIGAGNTDALSLQPLESPPSSRPYSASAKPEQAATVLRATQVQSGFADFIDTHRQNLLWAVLVLVILGMVIYFGLQLFVPSLFIKRPPAISSNSVPAVVNNQSATTPAFTPETPRFQPQEIETRGRQETDNVILQKPNELNEKIAKIQKESPSINRATATTNIRASKSQLVDSPTGVSVKTSETVRSVNPKLIEAYRALKAGNIDLADTLYRGLYQNNPASIDVLLGLAVIAQQKGDTNQASRYYVNALELEPKNGTAQAGLIGIFGALDPISGESRLKQLIAREPSAYLYFTLGNLYADQSKWAAAQDAYFQAYHLEPDNADYAYNLSISLEHISQPKIALHYYQQALQLAQQYGRASFEAARLQKKIELLTSTLE